MWWTRVGLGECTSPTFTQQSIPFDMLSKGLLLVTVFSLFLEDASAANPTCKAIPGQAGWPSATTWQNLNSTVGGRLLAVPPPGGACHAGEPNFNLAVCTQLQTEWYTYAYHAQNPISNGWQNWNNDTCLPNPATPCSGQGYPTYVINATSPQDVQAGVNFGEEICGTSKGDTQD